ncbi:MAG: hypothetical protein ACOYZ8_04755 [Chloroflexota bacterium]
MGIGRRDFLKLFGTALLAVASQPVSRAITIIDDTYVNRKLGIAFQKPPGWYYNEIKDMGEVAKGQILELIDAKLARKIIEEVDTPFVSISQEPVTADSRNFCPGINAFVEVRPNGEVEESAFLKGLLGKAEEPVRTMTKDIIGNRHILKNFRIVSGMSSLQISHCPAIQYTSSFVFEHTNLTRPVEVQMNTLLIVQNEYWYTFRMYDAPSLGKEYVYDYQFFMNNIWLV